MIPSGRIAILPSSQFRRLVEERSRQNILRCYQCGKCSAGCPVAYEMDMGPRQIMRAVQLGLEEEALTSTTIWLCVYCQTCTARCPRDIDISQVMEALRRIAISKNKACPQKEIKLFHRLFLDMVKSYGRVSEFGIGLRYNLLGRQPFANISMLPPMLKRRKMPLLPERIKGAAQRKGLFQKARDREVNPVTEK